MKHLLILCLVFSIANASGQTLAFNSATSLQDKPTGQYFSAHSYDGYGKRRIKGTGCMIAGGVLMGGGAVLFFAGKTNVSKEESITPGEFYGVLIAYTGFTVFAIGGIIYLINVNRNDNRTGFMLYQNKNQLGVAYNFR